MKKFVVVIISILVLFIFLVLNYLLWDKENLLRQRENDRIEQDWLRGENRNLQATVDELEGIIAKLEDQNDTQRDKIVELEQQVRLALQRENSYLKDILEKNSALNDYKVLMKDKLSPLITQWFEDVTKNMHESSYTLLDKDFLLWSNRFDEVEYKNFVSMIESISLNKTDKEKSFIILEHENPYIVKVQLIVDVTMKKGKNIEELENGSNILEVQFQFNRDVKNWAIMSIKTAEKR